MQVLQGVPKKMPQQPAVAAGKANGALIYKYIWESWWDMGYLVHFITLLKLINPTLQTGSNFTYFKWGVGKIAVIYCCLLVWNQSKIDEEDNSI